MCPAGQSQGGGFYSDYKGQRVEASKQRNDVSYVGFRKLSLTSVCRMNRRDKMGTRAASQLECPWDGLG